MISRDEPRKISASSGRPHELSTLNRIQSPQAISGMASLDELQNELAEIERMIRLLEWASARPRAA